ncbi:MAG: hypothetical protein Q7R94_01555 [bacterium]|nr:hypothetical protein [bacterium]
MSSHAPSAQPEVMTATMAIKIMVRIIAVSLADFIVPPVWGTWVGSVHPMCQGRSTARPHQLPATAASGGRHRRHIPGP